MIHQPILLIHGFAGYPTNWTGDPDCYLEFLGGEGFDPDLIRVFNYGSIKHDAKPIYDNTGDMREIAHRLDQDSSDPELQVCSIRRLARESQARGGPDRITIIAHSSGGLIARYYLSRDMADEFGTQYHHDVSRLIMLGTPHRGVDLLDLFDPIPAGSLLFRLMARAHFLLPPDFDKTSSILRENWRTLHEAAHSGFLGDPTLFQSTEETPAFRQMHVGSEFLNDLNRPGAMPKDVSYWNIVGDTRADICFQVGKFSWKVGQSFGDFITSPASAGSIPNIASDCFMIREENRLVLQIFGRKTLLIEAQQAGDVPTPIHRNLRHHPAARKRILEILRSE